MLPVMVMEQTSHVATCIYRTFPCIMLNNMILTAWSSAAFLMGYDMLLHMSILWVS